MRRRDDRKRRAGNPWIFRELVEYERTGALPPRPSKQEIKDTMLRHARLQIEFKGNYLGSAR